MARMPSAVRWVPHLAGLGLMTCGRQVGRTSKLAFRVYNGERVEGELIPHLLFPVNTTHWQVITLFAALTCVRLDRNLVLGQ
jgi:hypothetical protein